MLTKLCLSVFLLSSSVFGLPVEDNEVIGSGIEYPTNSSHFPLNMDINEEDRMKGGQEAAIGQFPHHVSIHSEFRYACSGSILNERFILTAGACARADSDEYRVVVGAHDQDETNEISYKVQQFIRHEGYKVFINSTTYIWRNDIGLIRTATPIQFNNLVRPISLHPGFIGTAKAVASGLDSLDEKTLKFLNMNTMTNDECRKLITAQYPGLPEPPVHDYDTICAFSGRKEHRTNQDAGSPLTVDNRLVGISAWQYTGGPDGFTRVSNYIDWIESKIQQFQDI